MEHVLEHSDAADDEQLVVAVRVAEFDGLDAATLDRAADEQASSLDACGQRKQKRGERRGCDVHDRRASRSAAERRLNGSGGGQRDEEATAVVVCFGGDLAGGAAGEAAGERKAEAGAAGAVTRASGRSADAGFEDQFPLVG